MTAEQIKMFRDFYLQPVELQDGSKVTLAATFNVILDNDLHCCSSTDCIIWDDAGEMLHVVRPNTGVHSQGACPINVFSATYEMIQNVEATLSRTAFEKLLDEGFLSSLVNDAQKEYLKKFALSLRNQATQPARVYPVLPDDSEERYIMPMGLKEIKPDPTDYSKFNSHVEPNITYTPNPDNIAPPETETIIDMDYYETFNPEEPEVIIPDHQHVYGPGWTSGKNYHWKQCSCGQKSDVRPHTWNEIEEEYVAPEEFKEGKRVYDCEICHAKKEEVIPQTHVHSFSEDWKTSETQHWKECSCGEKNELADHEWDGGIIDHDSTEYETGIMKYTCNVCGYEREETIPLKPHTHKYDGTYTNDENDHWQVCTECQEETEHVPHELVDGELKEPTCTEDGGQERHCDTCGYSTTEVIPMKPHDYEGAEYQHDENDHWRVCVTCGEHEEDHTPHSFTEDRTEATCTSAGKIVRTCDICQYQTEEEIPMKDHTYGDWQYDDDNHWKECSECQHHDQEGPHEWDNGNVTIEPTCYDEGVKTFTCNTCQKTRTEPVDVLSMTETQEEVFNDVCDLFSVVLGDPNTEQSNKTTYENLCELYHQFTNEDPQGLEGNTQEKIFNMLKGIYYQTIGEEASYEEVTDENILAMVQEIQAAVGYPEPQPDDPLNEEEAEAYTDLQSILEGFFGSWTPKENPTLQDLEDGVGEMYSSLTGVPYEKSEGEDPLTAIYNMVAESYESIFGDPPAFEGTQDEQIKAMVEAIAAAM